MVQDDTNFVSEGWVVRHTVGDGVGHDVAMTIFMLQAFTIQGGASRCATEQEAACLHITSRPSQIADALEAKHRVVHIERHHDAVAGGVAGSCRNPAAHTARFVDTFLQDLTGFIFLVVHHLVFVDRRVLLTSGVINTDLAEQAFHAEGAGFVDQDGHHTWAEGLVTQQLRQKAHIRLGGGNLTAFGGRVHHGFEGFNSRNGEALICLGTAVWQVPTKRLATLVQVAHLWGVVRRLIERKLRQLAVWNR